MSELRKEEFFTPQEVAEKLKVSVRTIKTHLLSGELKGVKVGRLWRVTPEAIQNFLTARPQPAAQPKEGFDVVNAAIAREDGGACLHPLTMEGYSTEHLIGFREGA
jgi:excisionase family DNA binding protein